MGRLLPIKDIPNSSQTGRAKAAQRQLSMPPDIPIIRDLRFFSWRYFLIPQECYFLISSLIPDDPIIDCNVQMLMN
jgi:hypothetical protein